MWDPSPSCPVFGPKLLVQASRGRTESSGTNISLAESSRSKPHGQADSIHHSQLSAPKPHPLTSHTQTPAQHRPRTEAKLSPHRECTVIPHKSAYQSWERTQGATRVDQNTRQSLHDREPHNNCGGSSVRGCAAHHAATRPDQSSQGSAVGQASTLQHRQSSMPSSGFRRIRRRPGSARRSFASCSHKGPTRYQPHGLRPRQTQLGRQRGHAGVQHCWAATKPGRFTRGA